MEVVGIREAARRLGVNHAAVQKRIKAGTLSTVTGGKLDWDITAREWTANRDASKVRKQKREEPICSEMEQAAGKTEGRSFLDAKTKREYIRLEKEALELKRIRGDLAPVGEINAFVAGMIIRSRDLLLRIGPELKDRLAHTSSPHTCEEMIAYEIRRALNELSEYKPAVVSPVTL